MNKKKLLIIFAILLLFSYGIYIIFPYYIDWAIRTDLARYHEQVSSYYETVDELTVYNYTDNFTPVAYASLTFGQGIIMINEKGEHRPFVKGFKYRNHIWQLYYNNSELWLFPGYYTTIMYMYEPEFIYVLNTTNGKITNRIPTNGSDNAQGYCIHNKSMHILFDDPSRTSSYGEVKNKRFTKKLELARGTGGSLNKYICTPNSLISDHYDEILSYDFSNSTNATLLTNDSTAQLAYNGKDTIYYAHILNNESIFVEHNITSGEKKEYAVNITLKYRNFDYINGDIFLANSDNNKTYRYDFPTFKLKEVIAVENLNLDSHFHYFGENRYLIGSSIITIYPNKTKVINTSLPYLETVHFIGEQT